MANYFHTILDKKSRTVIVHEAIQRLAKVKFDTIVCRGRSGLSFAAVLAYLMNKELVIINKEGVSSHDSGRVSVAPSAKVHRFIIVDDFSASGTTVKTCYDRMMECFDKPEAVGVYFYKNYNTGDEKDFRGVNLKVLNRNPEFSYPDSNIVIGYHNR